VRYTVRALFEQSDTRSTTHDETDAAHVEADTSDHLDCPLAPLIGPDADLVHARSMEWARRMGLARDDRVAAKLAATRFGHLASRAYPHAGVDDRVLITGWLIYVAVLDDQCDADGDVDTMRAMFRGIVRYLRTGRYPRFGVRPAPKPLQHALGSLWQRTSAPMPAAWRTRFTRSMAAFLDGVASEARWRELGRSLALDEYLQLRRDTSACGPLFDLIEFGAGRTVPDAVLSHPAVDAVRSTAVDVVAWINDLASMSKEEAAGSDHNLVLTIRRTGGLSTSLARAVATDMVNDGIHRLWTDAAALPDLDPALPDYVAGLQQWVRANIDWSADSGRYRTARAAAA